MYNLRPLVPGDGKNSSVAADGGGKGPRDAGDAGDGRWTLLDVLRWTTRRFQERGLPSARLDAEVLIATALHLTRVQLYVEFERPLDSMELAVIRDFVRRRQNGECVAYVVGHKEFFGLDFAVDPRVLVPRPDTETLVDESLARVRERGRPEGAPPPRIADVGTGSGAILVAVGKHVPGAQLFGVDISADALAVAAANAVVHEVTATWLCGELAEPLHAHAPFDLIVANLPYIPSADIPALSREVRGEPHQALDGGTDGLALVRRLLAAAPALLVPGGCLAVEIGAGQAEATTALFRDAALVDVRVRRDLGTVERVVSALTPADPLFPLSATPVSLSSPSPSPSPPCAPVGENESQT
jgi:release factor glutamine methyltransferase